MTDLRFAFCERLQDRVNAGSLRREDREADPHILVVVLVEGGVIVGLGVLDLV